MILFDHVTKHYSSDPHPALDNVSLHIAPNEFVFLVGKSGAGKSTLLKMITKEELPDSGKIVIGGIDLDYVKKRHIPHYRRRLGVVFQDFKLLPMRTVYENVAFALEIAGMSSREIEKTVPTVLDLVGLGDKAYKFPDQLAGGEQQRVSIARSVARQPKILIADEPTGNLDKLTRQEIIDLLKKINDFGTTVLVTTHDENIVNYLKRRVITLKDGKIVSDQKDRGIYVLDGNNDGINLQRPGYRAPRVIIEQAEERIAEKNKSPSESKSRTTKPSRVTKASPRPSEPKKAPTRSPKTAQTSKTVSVKIPRTKPSNKNLAPRRQKTPLNTPGRKVL